MVATSAKDQKKAEQLEELLSRLKPDELRKVLMTLAKEMDTG